MASTHNEPDGQWADRSQQPDSSGGASLYALCARVPLIKSPAVRVPPPIAYPTGLHPLPPNVTDYFVYPFSLEHFVLDAAKRREQARRMDMQRRAPGWNEGADVLQPTRRETEPSPQQDTTTVSDVDELGQMLDRLEHSTTSTWTTGQGHA